MNLIALELAKKVIHKHQWDVGTLSLYDEQIEKFAELIVKECADKCLAMAYVNPGPHHYAAMIKEHFGVKE